MFAVKSQPEEVFGLPNIKSAKKRVQLAEVRNARNKADKSALKTALKKFEAAAAEGNRTEAEGAYKVAVKIVDKSAAKGLLHKNKPRTIEISLSQDFIFLFRCQEPCRYH